MDPPLVHLGSFSTLEPLESDLVSGTTDIVIISTEPWWLEVQVAGPIHRISDGLELPMERVPEAYPGIPDEIINLQPYIYNWASGSESPVIISGEWLELSTIVEAYLEPGDPPGTYEAVLFARLLDSDGSPVTGYETLTMQFDVEPWVDLVMTTLPDYEISVPDGTFEGEGDVVLVSLASNTSWVLSVRGTGDLLDEQGGGAIGVSALSVCGEEVGGGITRRPWRSGCETVQLSPTALAAGGEPDPFTVSLVEIPIFFRFEGEPPLPAGRYGASLVFEATANGFAP
ncbi:MAG: hypothetical protein ABIE42_02485 [Candidatus Eisenbacteria bacterium]